MLSRVRNVTPVENSPMYKRYRSNQNSPHANSLHCSVLRRSSRCNSSIKRLRSCLVFEFWEGTQDGILHNPSPYPLQVIYPERSKAVPVSNRLARTVDSNYIDTDTAKIGHRDRGFFPANLEKVGTVVGYSRSSSRV